MPGRRALRRLCLTAVLVAPPAPAEAQVATQTVQAAAPGRLRVYLDCDCFEAFLRDEIRFVDFVRQPQDADVHVLARTSDTGGGGRETVMRFIGRGRFAGHDEELKAISLSGDAESTRRDLVLRTVQVGLLAFMAREGLPGNVDIAVESRTEAQARQPGADKWNFWVFSLRGSAEFNAEETQRDRQWSFNFGADRITEEWKITGGLSLDHEVEEFDLDEEVPLEAVRTSRSGNVFVARSWGPHWSIGVNGELRSSTFGNTKFAWEASPAIEYSVFPYADYARRQLRLNYAPGVRHARYNEITLYDRLDETHPVHQGSITFERSEPWGSIDLSFEFSQYLHDLSKYRLEINGDASFRIARGFTVSVDGGISRIRDQLSLPRRDATQEEVLLRLRELQSAYDISFDVGFTYSFGALFNNIVNPRFGR